MSIFFQIVLILLLVFPTIEDVKTREIRNIYFLTIFLIKGIWLIVEKDRAISSLVSLLIAALIIFFCFLISRGGMGKGDVKLLLAVAFYVETELFLRGLLFTAIGSLLFSGFLLARKQISKKDELPFVPFILFGNVVSTLFEVIK